LGRTSLYDIPEGGTNRDFAAEFERYTKAKEEAAAAAAAK